MGKGRYSQSLPLSIALGLLSCSSASPPAPKPPVARPADSGPVFESPARWAAFPQQVGLALSTLVLADGHCLVTTDDGQRWLVTPKDKKKPCAGPGRASGSPSFEPLVGAQQVGDEFRFVAEGGLVYTAREPAGPFTKFSRAPVTLKRVATVGNAIVGIDGDGGTHYFDGAWKASTVPAGSRGIDVGIDKDGRVLWLGAPETAMLSSDFGHTFKPITSAPRVGAYEVGFTQKGELAARGALGNAVLDGERLTFTRERLRETEGEDVEIEPAEGPKASLLVSQRSALFGASYAEILEPYEGTRYGLGRSPLGAPFEREALALFDGCDNVKLAAAGSALAVACLKQVEDKPNLAAELWLAKDGKVASFAKVTSLMTPSFNDVSLSVAADGTMLVVGACKEGPPPAAPGAEPAATAAAIAKPKPGRARVELPDLCSPKNPILVRGDSVTVGQSQSLEEGSARSPLLSADGHAAYFLGRSRKDSRPAVFVSKDGGKTYQIRVIEPPQTSSWGDETGGEDEGSSQRPFYVPDQSTLTMDETGTLGLAGERDMGFAWVTLDSEGRVANVADPPEPSMTLGGAGNRVIALAYGQMDGVLRSWESLDGGANWSEVTTTQAVVRYTERGSGVVSCANGGCLLGEELVRIGWEGQSETAFNMTDEPMADPIDVKLGVGIACQLSPKSSWVEIEGRPEERVSGSSYSTTPALPRLRDIMRGKTAFSVATVSVEDQSVDVLTAAVSDKEAPVTKKNLIGPAKSDAGGNAATLLRWQSEGFVALRAKVPTTKLGAVDTSKKIDGLEVAWQNQYLGTAGKKTLKLDTDWAPAFVAGTSLRPSMLHVTNQGVVLQVQNNQRVTFADGRGQTSYELPSLHALLIDTRSIANVDTMFTGGNLFATTFADRSPTATVFVTAQAGSGAKPKKPAKKDGAPEPKPDAGKAEAFAQSVAPSNAETDWLFSGDKVGVMTFTSATSTSPAKATGFMVDDAGKLGEAFELPTLRDLPERPKPCSNEQRKTPRVPSPHYARSGLLFQGEGRHPIVVSEAPATATASLVTAATPLDPIWLLSDGAILHGTKKEPCVAGYRASGLRPGTVAVIGGDLERSYLLRVQSGLRKRKDKNTPAQWGQYLQARPMSCRWQADLAVPVEVSTRASQRLGDDQP